MSHVKSVVLEELQELQEIKAGDIVRLKTSGPRMVADTIDWNKGTSSQHLPKIRCVWFVGNKLEQGVFNKDSLVLVKSCNGSDS